MYDWESQKFKLREHLSRIEVLLGDLSVIMREYGDPSKYRGDEESGINEAFQDMCDDFESHYRESEQLLARVSGNTKGLDSTRIAQIERFKDALASSKREWVNSVSTIQDAKNRQALLRSGAVDGSVLPSSSASTLLNERKTLVQSMGMIDGTLDTASAAHDMLQTQKHRISNISDKLVGITAHVPGINSLLSRINNRQFQEKLILSIVIGACISIIIWMRLLR